MNLSQFSPASALVTVIFLGLAPFVAVMVTSFTKIVVTLSLLRNALGLQQVPPNTVLNGLALVLTIYVMYPVGVEMQAAMHGAQPVASSMYTPPPAAPAASSATDAPGEVLGAPRDGQMAAPAPAPLESAAGSLSDTQHLMAMADAAKEPLRRFLLKHSPPRERDFFMRTVRRSLPPEAAAALTDRDFVVVVPAFTISELTAAFQIGFLIFLPFLIIDLVISNILLAMGMMMLSPTTVSLPFKLLLFVLIDGWVKLAHGLVLSYS